MLEKIKRLFRNPAPAAEVPPPVSERKEPKLHISSMALSNSAVKPEEKVVIEAYKPPKGVVPAGGTKMANDAVDYGALAAACGQTFQAEYFRGYPYLALLSQRPEFRKMSEIIAQEMTRKWIKLISSGDDDKSEKIGKLEAAMRRYHLQEKFQKMAEWDGFFGRGQLYIDLKMPGGTGDVSDDPDELQIALIRTAAKIPKGSLKGFNAIEPVWTYPGPYNSDNPLKDDFYQPKCWYVMGKTVHRSRLLTFISREMPDLLKAAYNFGGISLSQMAEPYVDNWIRTRDSVGDVVHSFTINGISTDMSATLTGGNGDDIFSRLQLFNNMRDNRGALVLDKEREEFFQFNTPLAGLDDLQAQAQEQQSSVSSVPLSILLGVTPKGLNASSDGEILIFETGTHARQEKVYRTNLQAALEVIQLSEFGEIDPDITFEFVPLRELDGKAKAEIEKLKAETDAANVAAGIISPDEARGRLASDPEGAYQGLDANPKDDDSDVDLEQRKDVLTGKIPGAEDGQPVVAAGIVYIAGDGTILLIKRGADQDHPGKWAFPAGHVEAGESAQAGAMREFSEEVGCKLIKPVRALGQFGTFAAFVCMGAKFDVALSDESVDFMWADPDELPSPMHPGALEILKTLDGE